MSRASIIAAVVGLLCVAGVDFASTARYVDPSPARASTVSPPKPPAPRTASEAIGRKIALNVPPLWIGQVVGDTSDPHLLDVRVRAQRFCAMSVPARRIALAQGLRQALALARPKHVRIRISRLADGGTIRDVWAIGENGSITLTSVGRETGTRCGA